MRERHREFDSTTYIPFPHAVPPLSAPARQLALRAISVCVSVCLFAPTLTVDCASMPGKSKILTPPRFQSRHGNLIHRHIAGLKGLYSEVAKYVMKWDD